MVNNKNYIGLYFTIILLLVEEVRTAYPQDSLRCYTTLTRPYNKLICPEAENACCIKEVSTLSKDQCGRSIYHGDRWNTGTGECIWKKCSSDCAEGSSTFLYKGEEYTRQRFTCDDRNYCNGAKRLMSLNHTVASFVLMVTLILWLPAPFFLM
mmetsp:Transcript_41113/g.54117  ORF Transcript_41113/g.54117 Transcript_41113/m.54117 type:complete len:153 (-) Transcript_41113:236-694(-)